MKTHIYFKETHGFDWINFLEPSEEELTQLGIDFQILPLYIQDIMQAEHLPKAEINDDENGSFIIARVLDPVLEGKEFKNIPEMTRKLAIIIKDNRIVTIQRARLDWMEAFIQRKKAMPKNGFLLVCSLLKATFRSFEPLIARLSSDLDFFEQKLFENERFPPFAKSLYSLRRKASLLKRLFELSHDLTDYMQENGQSEPVAQDAIDMFDRISSQLEDLNERSSGLINMNLAISSQRSNEVMRFLTIYSAFFMPLTFLVGVYGMNFKIMPELDWKWGYFFSWCLMIGIAGFHFWWFKKKRWL